MSEIIWLERNREQIPNKPVALRDSQGLAHSILSGKLRFSNIFHQTVFQEDGAACNLLPPMSTWCKTHLGVEIQDDGKLQISILKLKQNQDHPQKETKSMLRTKTKNDLDRWAGEIQWDKRDRVNHARTPEEFHTRRYLPSMLSYFISPKHYLFKRLSLNTTIMSAIAYHHSLTACLFISLTNSEFWPFVLDFCLLNLPLMFSFHFIYLGGLLGIMEVNKQDPMHYFPGLHHLCWRR